MIRSVLLFLCFGVFAVVNDGVVRAQKKDPPPAKKAPKATDPDSMVVKKDFKVELLYTVPDMPEGSWVSMCTDPKGRLIVSDQYGGLYRVTPPPLGVSQGTKVEKLPIELGEAQGLLWAFDSLYVVINGSKLKSGVYRVRSKDGDTFEAPETIRLLSGGGEHGPHAIIPAPDGKSLYLICGNNTKLTEFNTTRVPKHWGEDHLLPRMPDGRGFMRGVLGPGGAIYHLDPEGKHWELVSVGYRNPYDIAFNKNGDLFTYDADMEWDFNTPWYRPTRVCLATSGSEFGWRNGAGKWPAYYPDNLPGVYNIGPGSPTGIVFGYGAKFPTKYQDALFICDWSYGKLYAVHLTPHLSGYSSEAEEFVSGAPLPLTDLVVNPKDGALYFAIGGRKTQSALYRVTYVGKEPTTPVKADEKGADLRALRKKLESLHKVDAGAVEAAWPHLNHEDRYIRFAARVALEHQPIAGWTGKALSEKDPGKAIVALLALTRSAMACPQHHPKAEKSAELVEKITTALASLDWAKLSVSEQIELVRTYAILFSRTGKPTDALRTKVLAQLDKQFPHAAREVNSLLCEVLVFLEAPETAARALKLLETAPTQEEQMDYAKSLRMLRSGWTMEQRKAYFSWFLKAATFKGGMSFAGFMKNIKDDAVALLSPAEKTALKAVLEAAPLEKPVIVGKPRPHVKNWTLDELVPELEKGLTKRNYDRGRTLFGVGQCFACHRFDNDGGAQGPDLTTVSGRFSPKDLLESIMVPNKEISDQYAAMKFELDDGRTVTGRVVNLSNNNIMVLPNMLDPSTVVNIDSRKLVKTTKSSISMMPEGLLNTMEKEEILDLMAYILSRGDRNYKAFK